MKKDEEHNVGQESNETIIEISSLKKSFGSNHVLTGYDLKVNKGDNVVVLGKSGSGKSVLIKCIVGLLGYDSGSIRVFDSEISSLERHELDSLRSRIGFVFQSSALYDSMTVRQNLEFPLRRHGKEKSKSEILELVKEALNQVGLIKAINQMPAELSGGMRKRIGLARSLVLKPEIILYDEPTTGLDPITSMEIINLMLDIQEKYNTTSITISHDMRCAQLTGDSFAFLVDGKNYLQGEFDEIKKVEDPNTSPFFK